MRCLSLKICLLLSLSLAVTLVNAKVIHEERSLYRNIFVDELGNQRCLKFSVKRRTTSQSCINTAHPQKLVFEYTKQMMTALAFVPEPKRVLIIGLGGGTMSNSLMQLYPNIEIDNVEIDPAVIRVARQYFAFKESDRVKSYAQDGRIFIKRSALKSAQYDLIMLDAFNGEYIPEHLLTKEFLQEALSILTDDGVLVANTFSTSKLYDYETATYHAVFGPFYQLQQGFKRSNRVIITGKSPTLISDEERLKQLQQDLKPYDVDLADLLDLMRVNDDVDPDVRILTDQYSPANLL
ncbi:fused MFS/spermidine synthase [Thalassotalea ponticola]|uniref:spermidine synthase n=1 Tax=Thalassotalea ponticola TaxID=1523392 RepID=UPI0025B5C961|nr:fused MFS/spermidine synthase [Thalassotalea ponticola]MDN3652488.1 fused MFS/spermidine synthase [Thalassotalea ponticola]